jgi:hypothetical protein
MLEVGSKPLDAFLIAPVEKPGFFRLAKTYIGMLAQKLGKCGGPCFLSTDEEEIGDHQVTHEQRIRR